MKKEFVSVPENVSTRPEVRLLITVIMLDWIAVVGTAVLHAFDPRLSRTILACMGFNLIGGRAAGIGVFIYEGFSPWLTVLLSSIVEILIVMTVYPLFIMALNNTIRIAWIKRLADEMEKLVQKNENMVRTHGWWGLVVYIFVPLPMTGPVSGAFIGYLLRFSGVKTFSAVICGTSLISLLWAFAFDFLNRYIHIFQYVFAGFLVLMIILFFNKIVRVVKFVIRTVREPQI
ncbi:MAG: small multi-drug export protein [Fibrobacterota bacterium]